MCGESNRRWNEVIAAKCTVTQLSFTKRPISSPPFSIDRCSPFRKLRPCNDHVSPLRSDSFRGYRRLIGHRTMDPPFLFRPGPSRHGKYLQTLLFLSWHLPLLLSVLDQNEKEKESETQSVAESGANDVCDETGKTWSLV